MSDLRPTLTPKRTVSFGPSDSIPHSDTSPSSSSANPIPSSQSTPPSALKPALKPGTERKRLPPPEQYQHPDPLIRRLRLVDGHGKPVNLKKAFRETKVVGFYFSSQWAGQPLKEYHRTISEFCQKHPHEFKAIYVSVDVDEQWYKAGVRDKPWISMVWNDGSSLPAERSDAATGASSSSSSPGNSDSDPSVFALYNNEDFLLANESDIDESLSHTDKSGEAYLRPFSRVHLAAKLNIIAAPTLCIYHLESGKMLEWNVRMGRLAPGRVNETWERWVRGEGASALGLVGEYLGCDFSLHFPSFLFLLARIVQKGKHVPRSIL
ncbi:hypothetical protein IE53DRAFT_282913 [Violaceomyces palustris]|uniref:Uncharacterized protein n=1 Tax=Violaceomyces palustris TaxID=1673888 RepID=A0ACD0P2U7_9BASI|nr:hypothetical protein IE53DRAFT_282913 [Violaceomyces palustris]